MTSSFAVLLEFSAVLLLIGTDKSEGVLTLHRIVRAIVEPNSTTTETAINNMTSLSDSAPSTTAPMPMTTSSLNDTVTTATETSRSSTSVPMTSQSSSSMTSLQLTSTLTTITISTPSDTTSPPGSTLATSFSSSTMNTTTLSSTSLPLTATSVANNTSTTPSSTPITSQSITIAISTTSMSQPLPIPSPAAVPTSSTSTPTSAVSGTTLSLNSTPPSSSSIGTTNTTTMMNEVQSTSQGTPTDVTVAVTTATTAAVSFPGESQTVSLTTVTLETAQWAETTVTDSTESSTTSISTTTSTSTTSSSSSSSNQKNVSESVDNASTPSTPVPGSDPLLGLYIGVGSGGFAVVVLIVIIVCVVSLKRRSGRRPSSDASTAFKVEYSINSMRTHVGHSNGHSNDSTISLKLDDNGNEGNGLSMVHRRGHSTPDTRSVLGHRATAGHTDGAHQRSQARLPVDLRSAIGSTSLRQSPSTRDTATVFSTSGRLPTAASGQRSAASSNDVRQLVDSLLELKHRLEEYILVGVHLERQSTTSFAGGTTSSSSTSALQPSPQYDVLAAIYDVSSRISDVTSRYSSLPSTGVATRPNVPLSISARLPPSELISPGYLVEHLSALRPRIDRLARVLARSVRSGGDARSSTSGSLSAEVSSLETVLANVGASVSLAIDDMLETCVDDSYHRTVLLPPPTARTSSRQVDVYGRVRRPRPGRSDGRRAQRRRSSGFRIDPDYESIYQVRSVVSQLAVVRCRLQTLSELDRDQSVDSAGDIWWQAGLVVSLERLTEFLSELVRGDISRMTMTSSVTEVESTLARGLREAGTDFNHLLFDRLRAFHSAADGVDTQHPVHHNVSSPNTRWRHWDVVTSQLILDLLRDVLAISRSMRRPPETIRLRSDQPVHRQVVPTGRASSSHYGASTRSRLGTDMSTAGHSSRRHRTSNLGSSRIQHIDAIQPGERVGGSSRTGYVNPQSTDVGLGNFDPSSMSRRGGSTISGSVSATHFVTTDPDSNDVPDVSVNGGEVQEDDDDQSVFDVVIDRTSMTSDSLLDVVLTLYDHTPVEQLCRQVKVTFTNEAGVDAGALSREFFFVVFEALAAGRPMRSRSAFHGARGHLLPSIDHVLTESRAFWLVGVLLVQAVRRGCRGLPGLCNAIRHFLAAGAKISSIGRSLALVTMDDVADLELRMVLVKLKNKKDLNDLEQSVLERWLDEAKFTRVLKPSTTNEAVQRIICHYIFDSRMVQLQAIAEGMAELGFPYGDEDDVVDVMFPLDIKLTVGDFLTGIVFDENNEEETTEGASVSHTVTKRTKQYFRRYIDEVYNGKMGKLKLEDVLQFINGAPYFSSYSAAVVRFDASGSALPQAHACSSELVLPTIHRSYRNFRSALTNALEDGALGFGVA